MTPLQEAIAAMQAEVDAFGQGTKSQPKEHTASWFLLRGYTAGLSVLKAMERTQISDPKLCERYIGNVLKGVKGHVEQPAEQAGKSGD